MPLPKPTDAGRRLIYAALAFLLFVAGIVLVIYGRSVPHLRGWFGDYMITIFLYFSVKVFIPRARRMKLAAGVFLFSIAAELVQLSGIARRLDLTSAFWQLTIGSRFDARDIVMYAAGCVTAAVIDTLFCHFFNHREF